MMAIKRSLCLRLAIWRKNHAGDMKKKSLIRRQRNKAYVMTESGQRGGKRSLGKGARATVAACEKFSQKARYPLDLGVAKPLKRRVKHNQPGKPDPEIRSDTVGVPDKAKLERGLSDKTYKSGSASDGGVAQLVRAAES